MRVIGPRSDAEPASRRSPYRSEAERSIADVLSSYGIPFYYKQPTLVVDNGRRCIEYVDFFLPTYAGLSIDYCADPRGHSNQRKVRVYSENQVPAVLLTSQDISGQSWQQRLRGTLERMYHMGQTYRPRGKYR
jgi:hypothetical protein